MGKGLIRDRLVIQFPGGLPSDKSKGMDVMKELWKRYKTVDTFDASYWEGVVIGMIMERAFIRAYEKSNAINPATINAALESLKNEEFGGLVPAVTFTKDNHEGVIYRAYGQGERRWNLYSADKFLCSRKR